MRKNPLGVYEKALPKNMAVADKLALAKACGYDFMEMCVDASDDFLARLDWSKSSRLELVKTIGNLDFRISSLSFSANSRYPFGSRDAQTRAIARDAVSKAIDLAADLGIRLLLIAGYDVGGETRAADTLELCEESLAWAVEKAAAAQVMLGFETMTNAFSNSVALWRQLERRIASPWFAVYPDVGNIFAWPGNDVLAELASGIDRIAAIHLKETFSLASRETGAPPHPRYGEGEVDFPKIFALLNELNYRGCFVLEMSSGEKADAVGEMLIARRWFDNRQGS